MDAVAFTKLGFAAGMVKAASGDNQPGPMPQAPAPPDSHRKRNVALGAALLAGGLLGARHAAGTSTGKAMITRMGVAAKNVKARATTAGQGVKARVDKAMAPGRELQNQRFMAENKIDASPKPAGKAGKSTWQRAATKAKWMAAGGAALAGGSVAGASAASKANEAQSDDQPGLGRRVG